MTDLFDIPFEEEDDDPVRAPAPPPPAEASAPKRHIFTVSELTSGIRALVESTFGEVWIEGEISNC
jgi:hypothetical protein